MKTFLYGLVLAALVAGAGPAGAKEYGTSWGTVVYGSGGCDDGAGANHACFLQLLVAPGDLTVVKCYAPWDGWCQSATVGQTVIVSTYGVPVLPPGAIIPYTQLVLDPNGPTHSRY